MLQTLYLGFNKSSAFNFPFSQRPICALNTMSSFGSYENVLRAVHTFEVQNNLKFISSSCAGGFNKDTVESITTKDSKYIYSYFIISLHHLISDALSRLISYVPTLSLQ